MKKQYIELAPIKETTDDYEKTERAILDLLKKYIYTPLMKELFIKPSLISNSKDNIVKYIQAGRITYSKGKFSGDINSTISKELKQMGAVWDKKNSVWKLPSSALSQDLKLAIQTSEFKFLEKIAGIDKKLASLVPAEIAGQLQVSKFFDAALWKVQKDFSASLKHITIAPNLSEKQVQAISDEWQNNMRLWVQDFSEKQIKSLREDVKNTILNGGRYESLAKEIRQSYEVSENKSKFLARQETGLLMAQFKQSRYEEAGVKEYLWKCVAGSSKHPVRPMHKALDGKRFKWSEPPVTDEKGNRNNPGQDYNCRCFAKPIVTF